MVDNFSTIFESENSLSLLPFFLPLTIPIFIEEFPFPTEKRKRWKSWRLQKFYRLVPSRDRFRIACNIEEGKGRRRRGLRSPVRPFNIKCILFMQRCTFDNIPNGTLLWLHSITQRIPSNPSARNRTAKKLHRCSSVFPILHEEWNFPPPLSSIYIYTYFHRLHSTRSTFPFSFPLLLRFFTDKLGPRLIIVEQQKFHARTHICNAHEFHAARSSKNHFRNRGSRYSTGLLADISGIRAIPVISLTFETLIARIRMVTGRYYSELPYLAVRLFLLDPHIASREIIEAIISTIGRSTTERERIMTRCFVLRATEIVRIGLKRV